MQQRQLRLGDILDDYCPRERRLTNHAVVAMVEADVKRTRCTTCDAEHEYKHARVPHQRKKSEAPAALYSQVLANAPKKISHDTSESESAAETESPNQPFAASGEAESEASGGQPRGNAEPTPESGESPAEAEGREGVEAEGPVHRRLIRATLPRADGQPPPQRPIPEFTIRQPGGRQNRFRSRHGRGGGGQIFQGGRSNGGRPQGQGRSRPGHGRKRSK